MRINTVHLWWIANFWLLGRKVVAGMGMDANDPDAALRSARLLGARRARVPRRRHAARRGTPTTCAPYDGAIATELLEGTVAVDDEERSIIKKLNATLVNYSFLM